MVFVAGANAELSPEDVRAAESLIAGAAVVVVRLGGPDAMASVVARLDPHTYIPINIHHNNSASWRCPAPRPSRPSVWRGSMASAAS